MRTAILVMLFLEAFLGGCADAGRYQKNVLRG